MKSHTDLPQSKKLAEFLPLESADMHYNNVPIKGINYVDEYRAELMEYNRAIKVLSKYNINHLFEVVPCWSLAALLSYLNQDWYVNLSHDGICWQCVIDHHYRKERRYSSVLTDEPVDCCVELIVKLKEENLI